MSKAKHAQGFTLIELMVAVTLVAIIVAIAIPTYRDQGVKANRAEAKTLLLSTAQELERCFTRFSNYDNANCAVRPTSTFQTTRNDYTVTVAIPGPRDFVLTATPQGVQATRDGPTGGCGNLTINQLGQRNRTGTKPLNDCW